MRYFTSIIPSIRHLPLTWSDFRIATLKLVETPQPALDFGKQLCWLLSREADIDLNTKVLGFFISYSSRYADWRDMKLVLAFVEKFCTPAEKEILVKARIYYQSVGKAYLSGKYSEAERSAFMATDLNTGRVMCVSHVDHSDC